MNRVLLATQNPHKIKKLTWIVDGFFDSIENLSDCNLKINISENESSFKGNAETKVLTASKAVNGYAIATDGGVVIPALGDNWDALFTKRFSGEDSTDEVRIQLLLEMMKDKHGSDRSMFWREAIALAYRGQLLVSDEVEGVHGLLQDSFDPKKYTPGIWVCSVWYFPEIGKNFFDMTIKEQEYVEQSWHRLRKTIREYLKSNENHLPAD